MVHALAETVAAYQAKSRTPHTKLSISLPTDLVDELRAAAADSGLGVSGVVAAAVRRAIDVASQEGLDRALELDAEDNARRAADTLAATARAWADLKW
jgi:hypothetical protein